MGESITEGTIAAWLKQPGDEVEADEAIVEIETDKVTQEVPSPVAGVLKEHKKNEGDTVQIKEVIAEVEEGAVSEKSDNKDESVSSEKETFEKTEEKSESSEDLSPAVRKMVAENNVDISQIKGSGPGDRILKEDVQNYLEKGKSPAPAEKPSPEPEPVAAKKPQKKGERETVVPMSRLRQAIAKRLVEAQQNAAMLTTFNEVDMKEVMEFRSRYKEHFQKKYDVKLGFMSFFAKAVVYALKEVPGINAEIRGTDIVYKNYYDIGIAVGGPKGLVVPVVRDADLLSFAEIEAEIARLADKVKNGSITLKDMEGGSFTITNGGIYGSMMSTPILNPPQSGILGMHNIVKRPMVVNDEIVVRPMMYTALSYDHRIVDGKEAVTFLVKIKEAIEDPARLLLEV